MNAVDRTQAQRLTRIAQIAGVSLLALGVLAFIFAPGLPKAKEIVGWGDQPAQTQPTDPRDPDPIDVSFAANTLDVAGAIDKQAEQDQSNTGGPVVPPPARPGSESTKTDKDMPRFLGGFFSESRSLAIIATPDGPQRMVRVGDEIEGDMTVLTITATQMELNVDGELVTIGRESPSGPIVTTTSAPLGKTSVSDDTEISAAAADRIRQRAMAREAAARGETVPSRALDVSGEERKTAEWEARRRDQLRRLRERGIEVEDELLDD